MTSLSDHLSHYLMYRRQLGFRLEQARRYLNSFVRFARKQRAGVITTNLALRWATHPQNITPRQRAIRLSAVRLFATYVSTVDPRTEIPPPKVLVYQYRRPSPYLYCDKEVLRLIEAAGQICESSELKCATYATLFGLLTVTGMRVGEAIALNREDVDLDRALLTIPRAKGNKERLVPIHVSTARALQRYAQIQTKYCPRPRSSSFFLTDNGTRLCYNTVNRWFRVVSCRIGLRKSFTSRGPRLHDLRHRFAIQTLLRWYQSNVDVDAHLPELTTYLGHVHVNDTYWYLSAAPELLKQATLRWERLEGRRQA